MIIPPLTYQIYTADEELQTFPDGFAVVLAGLQDNFLKRLGRIEYEKPLHVFARDADDRIVGGLIGRLFCSWLFVASFWVEEGLRGRGVGKELLGIAESEAARMGCRYAHLETFTFEARPFYEKLGYKVFAVLEDYPPGQTKYFLKKKLVPRSMGSSPS